MKKINIVLLAVLAIVVVAIVARGYFVYENLLSEKTVLPVGWKTIGDYQYTMNYPKNFSGATWRAQEWPPSIVVYDDSSYYGAEACGSDISLFGQSDQTKKLNLEQLSQPEKVVINGMNFLLYKGNDAGVGQLYSNYCYVLKANGLNYVIDFLIHSTNECGKGNCGPWCGTSKEQSCKNFDMQKEVIQPIEQIVSTFKIISDKK